MIRFVTLFFVTLACFAVQPGTTMRSAQGTKLTLNASNNGTDAVLDTSATAAKSTAYIVILSIQRSDGTGTSVERMIPVDSHGIGRFTIDLITPYQILWGIVRPVGEPEILNP